MTDKYQKIDRVFEGLAKLNKEALKKFEEGLGREITFEEYLEKFLEDVSVGYIQTYTQSYFIGKKDAKKQGMTIFKGKK